jgi:hypothetical protein
MSAVTQISEMVGNCEHSSSIQNCQFEARRLASGKMDIPTLLKCVQNDSSHQRKAQGSHCTFELPLVGERLESLERLARRN